LKSFVKEIDDDAIRLFFEIAFSETVRESSNTRNGEFKLYRYKEEKLSTFSPDVNSIMNSKLVRNFQGLEMFTELVQRKHIQAIANIHSFNSVIEIPEDCISASSIDIVVTSPPYGDSRTTVAYGQYSRLSAAWLDLEEPEKKTDRKLMGGGKAKEIITFPCPDLDKTIKLIYDKDLKRGLEIVDFYQDYLASIRNVAEVIKPSGYACYVVANRKVKNTVLPTDAATQNFFEHFGFSHIDTFDRRIPNKRMALRNSPSNISGESNDTMVKERIIVMRKNPG